jgi:hypothetical protein
MITTLGHANFLLTCSVEVSANHERICPMANGTDSLSNRSTVLLHPLLDGKVHRAEVTRSVEFATRLGRLEWAGPIVQLFHEDIFSLAQWQSPFRDQGNRGACWAFAGTAALEAAYRRRFNLEDVNISEEYVFHMGKTFALARDAAGFPIKPVENNSSLTGFQGSGDIVQKISENAAPPENTAPYLPSQAAIEAILPVIGFAGPASLMSQEDFDAIEFCEQHVQLLARVNARYRATGWKTLGSSPTIAALENTLLANHEVVCDVTHVPSGGGHVLLLIGFNRTRQVFMAKNSWGEGAFIEIAYSNDPTFTINSGWYIEDVVDPTFVQNEACWLGNWRVTLGDSSFRMLLRRAEDFASPGSATKLGTAYLGDGPHDVNGQFHDNGASIELYVAPSTASVLPGTLVGTRFDARLDFRDIYNAAGTSSRRPVTMSRFQTRFAALFEEGDGAAWQARHGIDGAAYQATFDDLAAQGFRLVNVNGYSEGTGARFNAVWVQRPGPAWQARHGLTSAQYQATFDGLVAQGFRLICVSGYAENGEARYAAIWEQRDGPEWQARHGLSRGEYQSAFDEFTAQGLVPVLTCGYRVNVDVRFATLWERRDGVGFVGRHGLTASEYQAAFDAQLAAGFRLVWVSGYSDTGIARYAALWHNDQRGAWQARHGFDAAGYQREFDRLAPQGFRPLQVAGYGDGFYAA